MRLNHVDLPVPDTTAARRFFETHFGFRCLHAGDALCVLLGDGGFALTLSALPPDEALHYPSGFHVGFNLDDEADLRVAYARLQAAGAPIVRPLGLLGNALTFQCEAPGPVVVELGYRPPR